MMLPSAANNRIAQDNQGCQQGCQGQNQGQYPLKGRDGLTVPGSTRAIGESSSTPFRGYSISGAGGKSQEPCGGQGRDCPPGGPGGGHGKSGPAVAGPPYKELIAKGYNSLEKRTKTQLCGIVYTKSGEGFGNGEGTNYQGAVDAGAGRGLSEVRATGCQDGLDGRGEVAGPGLQEFGAASSKERISGLEPELAGDHLETWADEVCGKWSRVAICEKGHGWARVVYCGRDWCPTCGEKWSDVHKRRFARWLPKARKLSSFRYLVVEWEDKDRNDLRDVAELRRVRLALKRYLKRNGYANGLSYWHFFGDKRAGKFNPHLNIIVEGGYMPKKELDLLKRDLPKLLGYDGLIVRVQYKETIFKRVHCLKYITRATFMDWRWDSGLADKLYRFNRAMSWGKWADLPDRWELPVDDDEVEDEKMKDVASLEENICPICNTPLRWWSYRNRRVMSTFLLRKHGYQDHSAGWMSRRFRSPPRSPVPDMSGDLHLDDGGWLVEAGSIRFKSAQGLGVANRQKLRGERG